MKYSSTATHFVEDSFKCGKALRVEQHELWLITNDNSVERKRRKPKEVPQLLLACSAPAVTLRI